MDGGAERVFGFQHTTGKYTWCSFQNQLSPILTLMQSRFTLEKRTKLNSADKFRQAVFQLFICE